MPEKNTIPPFATVGDSIECDVRIPFRQTIRMRLVTPEATAHANSFLVDAASGWRLVRPLPTSLLSDKGGV